MLKLSARFPTPRYRAALRIRDRMFDPLHKWLGIPAHEQPPNHYRLLAIALWESDPEVIDAAADKQLAFLHDMTNGEQAPMAEELSNQVSAARLRLLDRKKKQAYDVLLCRQLESSTLGLSAAHSVPVEQAQITSSSIPMHFTVSASPELGTPIVVPIDPSRASRSSVKVRPVRPGKKQDRTFWLRQISILSALTVLAMLGIGIRQGKLLLDLSPLESLGVPIPASNDPSTTTVSPDPKLASGNSVSPPPSTDLSTNASDPLLTSSENSSSSQSTPTRPATTASEGSSEAPGTSAPTFAQSHRTGGSLADLMNGAPANDTPTIVKSVLPSKNDLDVKMTLVRELYHDRYRDSKTITEKIELAQQMHRDGELTTEDPVGRFALWQVAKDILQLHGQIDAALGIIDNMESHYFECEECAMKADVIRAGVDSLSPLGITDFVDATLNVVDGCVENEQFETGQMLVALIQQKLGTRLISAKADELESEKLRIASLVDKFQQYRDGLEAIKRNHADPDANRDVGEYLCLVRGEWDEGLNHLALGPDDAIRSAAVQEMAVATKVTRAIDAGDAWYVAAEAVTDESIQSILRRRSWMWYTTAINDVSGLEQKKLELRMADLTSLVPELSEEDSSSSSSAIARVLGYLSRTSSESKSDSVSRRGNTFTLGMGTRPDGRGEAEAGIEFNGVEKLTVVGAASHQSLIDVDAYSKTGFMVDYHTPSGYTKRVFLGTGLRAGRQFTDSPPWGKATKPDVVVDLGRNVSYEIDLTRWAPSTWDQQCWFTIVMQNVGINRHLEATLSW